MMTGADERSEHDDDIPKKYQPSELKYTSVPCAWAVYIRATIKFIMYLTEIFL